MIELKNKEDLRTYVLEAEYPEIKKYKEEVCEEIEQFTHMMRKLDESRNCFKKYEIDYNEDDYSIVYERFEFELNELNGYLKNLKEFIAEKQQNCAHDMKYMWHDSHYDYYKCVKCGKEERY